MRRILLLALLSLIPAVSALSQQPTSSTAAILAAERLFWTNYTSANTAGLARQFTPDFRSVEQETWNGQQVLNFVSTFFRRCSLAPVTMREPRVIFLTLTIATLTYRAIEAPTCGIRTFSGDTNISTVWVLRDGRWQMHLHTEYAIPRSKPLPGCRCPIRARQPVPTRKPVNPPARPKTHKTRINTAQNHQRNFA